MKLPLSIHNFFSPSKKNLYPQREKVERCLKTMFYLLFPDHHRLPGRARLSLQSIWVTGQEEFFEQVQKSSPQKSKKEVLQVVDALFGALPLIQERLFKDAKAAFDRDPAAQSVDEVILSYPGFLALMIHRLAHELALLEIPLIPRMMSEYAHSLTGCDIHPEAKIGEEFFIDHATGVVIGQTAVIGNRVTVFQGVTLGALALKNKTDSKKRHPTLEDDVILYSHATVLGGQTVIGKRSIIGGSCWITSSVPPDSKIILAKPQMIVESRLEVPEYVPNWDI